MREGLNDAGEGQGEGVGRRRHFAAGGEDRNALAKAGVDLVSDEDVHVLARERTSTEGGAAIEMFVGREDRREGNRKSIRAERYR
jgi:hypothetical protein